MLKKYIWSLLLVGLLLESAWAVKNVGPIEAGGQFRTRYQVNDPTSFSNTSEQTSTDLLLFRTRVWGKTEIEDKGLRIFVEIQDSRTSGSEASVAANTANVDLHQGYIDILKLGGKSIDLRVGRHKLKYGDQRLISTLEWSNVARSWDGATLSIHAGPVQVDVFHTIITEVTDIYQDQKFSGVYSMFKGLEKHEFDLYLLSKHSGEGDTTTTSGASLNLNQYTAGTRAKGKTGAVDYSGELVKQFGKSSGMDIKAHAFAVTGGVTLPVKTTPRVGVGYDYASGDDNPTDNEIGTFDPLFPFGHYYQGHADVFSWKNGEDLQAHFSFVPCKGTKVMVAFHNFTLAEERDSWYGASGTAIGTDATGASGDDIGQEIDIHVKTTFREIIKIWFGYARFSGGDFVKRNFPIHDKDFFFFQGLINFGGQTAG